MYKYVKVGEDVQNVAIAEDYQINKQTTLKIRDRYSVDNEFQMQRLGQIDPNNTEYQEYLDYVQLCVNWGLEQKQLAAQEKETWADYQWDESEETRNEFIQRIEKNGLI